MSVQIGSLVGCRGHEWAVVEYVPSPHGHPPRLRLSRIDDRSATSLVVEQDCVEVLGSPVFTQGDSVRWGLGWHGTVIADDGGDVVMVAAEFRPSS